jgi:hypothetical protein
VRNKVLPGDHDVPNRNEPDARMQKLMGQNLPGLMQEAKRLFEVYRETHGAYGKGDMNYFDWLKEILQGSGI